MSPPRMRPEFDLPHPQPAQVLMALAGLLIGDPACEGTVLRAHAVVRIKENARHFWSPQLELEVRLPDPDDEFAPEQALLHGRFAPHPHVWTGFMAIYALLVMAGTAGAMWGLSQLALGRAPWALAAAPAAIALAAFVHGAVFIGQGLGAAQMYDLRAIVDRAVARAASAEEATAEVSEKERKNDQ